MELEGHGIAVSCPRNHWDVNVFWNTCGKNTFVSRNMSPFLLLRCWSGSWSRTFPMFSTAEFNSVRKIQLRTFTNILRLFFFYKRTNCRLTRGDYLKRKDAERGDQAPSFASLAQLWWRVHAEIEECVMDDAAGLRESAVYQFEHSERDGRWPTGASVSTLDPSHSSTHVLASLTEINSSKEKWTQMPAKEVGRVGVSRSSV